VDDEVEVDADVLYVDMTGVENAFAKLGKLVIPRNFWQRFQIKSLKR
jgi:hypothetical protein